MFKDFTSKQKTFIKDIINNKINRINILEGSVRSGKTYVSLVAWLILLCKHEQDKNFLMVGKTITSLKRNCLTLLEELCPSDSFSYSITKKEAKIFDRRIFLEGVNDSRSEHKIRGMTLQGAYCDEITLFSEDFFSMLLSRLSLPHSFLLGTTNPDSPTHWLMKKYISRKDELNMKMWKFYLDDNDTIPENIRNDMKKEYTGVFYDRFILGNWVQAEGLIYSRFADYKDDYIINNIRIKDINIINIGIDYGASQSKTAFVAVGFCNDFKLMVALDEQTIEGVNKPEDLYKYVAEFYKQVESKYGWISCCYADWGGLGQVLTKGLKVYMHEHCNNAIVKDCKKYKIFERINILNRLIGANRFKVMSCCNEVIESLSSSIWDPKKENERLDNGTINIDVLDAMEYAYAPHISTLRSLLDVEKIKPRGLPII